jgi:uncharacterized protein
LVAQERTCCICRRKASKAELARLVVLEGRILYDSAGRLPGRGAYVHRRVDCILNMNQPERWRRALRIVSKSVDFDTLGSVTKELLKEIE